MKKRTDRAIAIGSIAAVVIVPTVLLVVVKTVGPHIPFTGEGPAAAVVAQRSPGKNSPSSSRSPSPYSSSRPSVVGGGTPQGQTAEQASPSASTGYRAADDGAAITVVKRVGTRAFDFTVRSPALGSSQRVRVLVPKAWHTGSKRTWPVVYAFHGGRDSYTSWTRSSDIAKLAAGYATMVVMPEGANGSYTDWYNHGKGGTPKWETFHTLEVRQLVERNFHAGDSRAAIGLSSGAQGAITYAARHPGMFKYAASYSGVLSMLQLGIPTLLIYTNSGNGADPYAIWGDPIVDRANWEAHDPATLLPKLRGVGLYVSSGNGQAGPLDDPNKAVWDIGYLSETQVYRTSQDFVAKAKELGIPVTADFYGNGSHSWPYWKRESRADWPAIMSAIGAAKS